VHENPTLPINFLNPEEWKEAFRNATHLERLALVRNPALNETLIEQIFDHEDQELGISLEARGELVKAFLTNHQAIRDSYRDQSDFIPGFLGGHPAAFTRAHFSKLWTLISKWPEGTRNLQAGVYRYIGAPDKTKAEIYQSCDEPVWRAEILRNSDKRDTQAIKLSMQDQHEQCRELAYSRVDFSQIHELDRILQGEDSAALRGLSQNRALPADVLWQVRSPFRNDVDRWYATQTIEEVERQKLPSAPGDKFDLIHEQLKSFKEQIQTEHQRISKNVRDSSSLVCVTLGIVALNFIIIPLIVWLSSIFKGIAE
jgi:hypothetical protein